jgi:predicted nucleic acid-binding protein
VTRTTGPPVAVLDANVLYPQWLRDVMLTLAAEGSFKPVWSREIIEEMRRNVLRNHPEIEPGHFDDVTVATLRRAFPDAWVEAPGALIAQMDNSPDDRHVLAAAVHASAGVIVTENIVDFASSRFVESEQIRIQTPATFLSAAIDEDEDLMATVLGNLAGNRRGVTTIGDVLSQLDRNQTLRPFVDLARTRLL